MNLVILIGLLVIGIAHALRGAIALRPGPGEAVTVRDPGGTGPTSATRRRFVLPLCGAGLAFVGLLVGWSALLPVPVGYAGGAGGLALDPLGCVFVLLLFLCVAWADAEPPDAPWSAGWRDLRTASITLAFLAGDAFLLACGACLSLLLPRRLLGRRGARTLLVSAFAIAGGCTLLSGRAAPAGGLLADPGFVLLRGGGGTATLLLPMLAVLAAMPLLGLWPMSAGFRHRCAFAPVWVPVTGMLLGQFLLIRLLLDLAGPVVLPGWGALLLVLGAGSAVGAAWSGLRDTRAAGVVGGVLAAQNGLGVAAIGLCMLARSNDLPVLAGSALDALWLLAPTSVLGGLCFLGLVRAIEKEAGSGALSRLGGLARSMPRTCTVLMLPLALLGAVPPLAGYAVLWLLLQVVLATPLPMPGGIAVLSLLLMLLLMGAAGLNAASLSRLGTVALLGRPRTPRGAAATDLAWSTLRRHLLLPTLPLLASLVPGLWLRLAEGRGGSLDGSRHPLFGLAAPAGNAQLFPLPVLLLLAVCLVGGALLVRLLSVRPERRQRGWQDGAPPPPPWLPFGDPATQIAPATLQLLLQQGIDLPIASRTVAGPAVATMRRGVAVAGSLRSALLRHAPMLAAAALVAALCALANGAFLSTGPAP